MTKSQKKAAKSKASRTKTAPKAKAKARVMTMNAKKAAPQKAPSKLASIKSLLMGGDKKTKAPAHKAKAASAKHAKGAKSSTPAKTPSKVQAHAKAAKTGQAKAAKAAPDAKAAKASKGAKSAKAAHVAITSLLGNGLTSTLNGRASATEEAVCREVACEGLATTGGYCRMHYIKNWKKIKRKEVILREGKLNQYIEELVAKYPDKYIEAIRQDLTNDKDFAKVIYDLDLDESIDEFSDVEGENVDNLIDNIKREFEDEGETF